MISIPTSAEFKTAVQEQFPPYSVQLPAWNELENAMLPDNVPDNQPPVYTEGKHDLRCSATLKPRIDVLRTQLKEWRAKLKPDREHEKSPNAEQGDTLEQVPHPDSDCRHVDPLQNADAFRNEFKQFMANFKKLEQGAKMDGELKAKYEQTQAVLADAEQLLMGGARGPKGMQRLRLIFEWALCHVSTVFGEINAALASKDAEAYEAARKRYIKLLRELDDSEPDTGPKRPEPGEFGYGRVIKWVYVAPIIHGGKIKGAKIVAKWNPHISSSGIPIPHS